MKRLDLILKDAEISASGFGKGTVTLKLPS